MLHREHTRRAFFKLFLGSLPKMSTRSSSGILRIEVAIAAKCQGTSADSMCQLGENELQCTSYRRQVRPRIIWLSHTQVHQQPLSFPPPTRQTARSWLCQSISLIFLRCRLVGERLGMRTEVELELPYFTYTLVSLARTRKPLYAQISLATVICCFPA